MQRGSLYSALHRLEMGRWLKSEWGEAETGREAQFYALTAAVREQLGARGG